MPGVFPAALPGCDVLPLLDEQTVSSDSELPPSKTDRRKKRAASDRFTVLNAFVDGTLKALSRGSIAVWLILYRDCRDGVASSSQADVARRAGMCDRSVRRAIDELVKHGLLELVYRGGINRGVSRYRVIGQRAGS